MLEADYDGASEKKKKGKEAAILKRTKKKVSMSIRIDDDQEYPSSLYITSFLFSRVVLTTYPDCPAWLLGMQQRPQ